MTWANANSSCQNYSFCGNLKGTLPTLYQLQDIYNNKSHINSLLSIYKGTQITDNYYWSSTSYTNNLYYIVYMSNGVAGGGSNSDARPILTSW